MLFAARDSLERIFELSFMFDVLFSQNVWSLPNGVLFRLHGIVQLGPRYYVRNGRIYRYQCIRAKDIFHSQDRLKIHH